MLVSQRPMDLRAVGAEELYYRAASKAYQMLVFQVESLVSTVITSQLQFTDQIEFLEQIQSAIDSGQAEARDLSACQIVDLIGAQMSPLLVYYLQDSLPLWRDPVPSLA